MREFETGALRDGDTGKYDFEGFLSPLVVEAFGAYMHFNRTTPKGRRDSDNWQKGIPQSTYIKSAWRHFFDWWKEHRLLATKEGLVWALCGLLFNVQGYLHEVLRSDPALLQKAVDAAEARRQNVDHLQWSNAKPPEAPETPAPFLPATRELFLAERTGLGDAVRASGKRAKR